MLKLVCLVAWLGLSLSLSTSINRGILAYHTSKSCGVRTTQKTSSSALKAIAGLSTIESASVVAGVIAFHEAGHLLAAKGQGMKVESFNIGYGPKLLSFNDTGSPSTMYALRALPLGGYVAFPPNVELDEDGEVVAELDDPDLLQNRSPAQRALVISGGVLANLLLTFLLSAGTAWSSGIGRPIYDSGIIVNTTPDLSAPAVKAGIRAGDVITATDGVRIEGGDDTMDKFISSIRARPGHAIPMDVIRDGKTVKLKVTPAASGAAGKGSIGIEVSARVKEMQIVKASGPIEAAKVGADETVRLVRVTGSALWRALSNGLSGSDVGGPISVVKAGASMAEYSTVALVGFAATLSINLALLNSLPIPALDGGQLVFVLFEGLSGKPIPRGVRDTVTALAFSALLLLSSYTLLSDVGKVRGQELPHTTMSRTAKTTKTDAMSRLID